MVLTTSNIYEMTYGRLRMTFILQEVSFMEKKTKEVETAALIDKSALIDPRTTGQGEDWSPITLTDGTQVFRAACDGRAYLVWGNREHGPYDEVDVWKPNRNAAGNVTPVYRAVRDGKTFIIVCDKELGPYDAAWDLIINGGDAFFMARRGRREFVIWNRQELGPYSEVTGCNTNASDGTPLYFVERGDERLILWNRLELGPYRNISSIGIAPNGRPVFEAGRENKWFIVHGKEEYRPYDRIVEHVLASDGTPVYCAERNRKLLVVYASLEFGPYDNVWSFHRVPDDRLLILCPKLGGQNVSIFQGQERPHHEKPYGRLADHFVTPGGTPVYCARRAGKLFIVYDREAFGPYDNIWDYAIAPDGTPFFCTLRRGKYFFLFGAEERGPYDHYWRPVAASDGTLTIRCWRKGG